MTKPRIPRSGQQETIEALLAKSGRGSASVPLRPSFVQHAVSAGTTAPLGELVRRGDERALDLFLLHRACASAVPWDVTHPSTTWARTLGLVRPDLLDSIDRNAGAQVSKVWRRLEDRGLVRRERTGRRTRVIVLDESGSGAEYDAPEKGYSRLPYAYWTADERWYLNLSLASKAVLLIAIQQRPAFDMPEEFVAQRYDISRDTWRNGSAELEKCGLLQVTRTFQEDWLAATARRGRSTYKLMGPFARIERKKKP